MSFNISAEVRSALKTKKVSQLKVGDVVVFDNVKCSVDSFYERGDFYVIDFRTPTRYVTIMLSLSQEVVLG